MPGRKCRHLFGAPWLNLLVHKCYSLVDIQLPSMILANYIIKGFSLAIGVFETFKNSIRCCRNSENVTQCDE